MKKENENFVKTALEDLEASKILYENGKYPQSIFFLQQSIEKVTKGTSGIHKHAHNTSEIYKKLVNEKLKEGIEFFKNIPVDDEKTLLFLLKMIQSENSRIDSEEVNLKVGKITNPNFILQKILSPHVNSTRYPKGEHNPLTKYTKDHFLVKHYGKIYNLQKDCLIECFKFISN